MRKFCFHSYKCSSGTNDEPSTQDKRQHGNAIDISSKTTSICQSQFFMTLEDPTAFVTVVFPE